MAGKEERRRADRFRTQLTARFASSETKESETTISNISKTGVAVAPVPGMTTGAEVVIYSDQLGRLVGKVVREGNDEAGIELSISPNQQATLERRIEALKAGYTYLRLADTRSNVRTQPNLETLAKNLDNDAFLQCTIKDISVGGCNLHSSTILAIGTRIQIGSYLKGVVCRNFDEGFAVKFVHE